MMIRPARFSYNVKTAVNNTFQKDNKEEDVQQKALKEFDDFVKKLSNAGVNVTVIEDTTEPHTPDSVFPNNWVSFHEDGSIVLYPMFAVNRRTERKQSVLDTISKKFIVSKTIDLSSFENENKFLEGTGSMVFDREHKIAYACLSQRTEKTLVEDFCKRIDYTPCIFTATDKAGKEIYHTNVMMCVADAYVVICMDSIKDENERKILNEIIASTQKDIIEISIQQMNAFAGNMLQVINNKNEKLLVMSTQAYESLTKEQVVKISSYNKIIHSPLNTIETNGGGSARCMMAEIFLKKKTA